MGYYTDLRDKIFQVEQQGFNPYTESLEGRIGQLSAQINGSVPPAQESALKQPQITSQPSVVSEPTMSDYFVQGGYDDPFKNMVYDDGTLNFGQLTAGYNILRQDPNAPYTTTDYLNRVNQDYVNALQGAYTKENYQVIEKPDGSLGFAEPKSEKDIKREFETAKSNKSDIYFGWELDEGGKRTGEKKVYEDKKSFSQAIADQLTNEGYEVTTEDAIETLTKIRKDKESQQTKKKK